MSEPLEIAVQMTPNPNAMKFTLNRVVATQGRTYRHSGDVSAVDPEWVKQLLGITGVTQVFALGNFISVNKGPDGDWGLIAPQVEQVLRTSFA